MRVSLGSTPSTEVPAMSELLDSELEAAMRSLLFWLTVPLLVMGVLCLVESAYALTIPFTDITILEPAEPSLNEATPVLIEPALDVKTTTSYEEDKTILDTVFRISGLSQGGTRNITVTLDGKFLGAIYGGSKFENLPVHKICLTPLSQYGTEEWYTCEVNLK